MKYQFTAAVLLLLVASASAQLVASHTPTATAPQTTAATPPASLQVTGKPVVRVNDAVLTDRDLLREMLALFPYARLHKGFPKQQEAEIRRGAMQMIIFEELVYQEAVRRKMTIAPELVLREEKKFKGQFGSAAEFSEYLKAEMDGSEAKLRRQIKRSLLIDAMLKNEVENKSVVSLSEAQRYYDKNPKMFEHDELFAIQTISLLPPANANPETLKEMGKRAETIWQQAKATKNYEQFGLLAEKVSEDDFHVDMGDHKTVKREKLPPEVVKAAQAMKPGDVSPLLQLGTAYTLFRLNAHTLPGKAKFADVKAELISRLETEKTEKLRVALDKQLHQNAKIQEM
jgi:hypothetical protein